jgi:hypothetical protein
MLKPPCDAHEAFLRLGPNLKEISGLVSDRRWSSGERQRLTDMLLGYLLGLACEYRRADLRLVHNEEPTRRGDGSQPGFTTLREMGSPRLTVVIGLEDRGKAEGASLARAEEVQPDRQTSPPR